MLRKLSVALVSLIALAAAGCSEEYGSTTIPSPDPAEFTGLVMPVLLRDCAFPACHGSQERFFRVYGPGRTRLQGVGRREPLMLIPDEKNQSFDGLERDYTLQLAVSMIDFENPRESLLLRKPLAMEAGGSSHEGVDKYGRNVYRTSNDEGYLKLARWVFYTVGEVAADQSRVAAGAAGSAALAP